MNMAIFEGMVVISAASCSNPSSWQDEQVRSELVWSRSLHRNKDKKEEGYVEGFVLEGQAGGLMLVLLTPSTSRLRVTWRRQRKKRALLPPLPSSGSWQRCPQMVLQQRSLPGQLASVEQSSPHSTSLSSNGAGHSPNFSGGGRGRTGEELSVPGGAGQTEASFLLLARY